MNEDDQENDAELYRQWQAEQLLREAGFVPDGQGHWRLAGQHDGSSEQDEAVNRPPRT